MSTQLAESPIPTSPPSPSAPPAPSPGQLPAQSSPVLGSESSNPTELSATAPVPRAPCVFRRCRFGSTLDIPVYSSVSCTKTSSRAGRPRPLPSGGAPGGTRASLDAEPEMELRKPALCCGGSSPRGPLLGVRVLSSGEAGGRGEASRASRDHLWVQPKSRLRPAHPRGSSGPGDTADSFRFEAGGAELLNTRDPNNQSLAAGCPSSLCV